MTELERKIEILENNVKELQTQLQEAYKRIAELQDKRLGI